MHLDSLLDTYGAVFGVLAVNIPHKMIAAGGTEGGDSAAVRPET